MNLKHKFYQAIKLYFMLVTFISILLMILGLAFDSERTFSYSVFLSPLIYAAVGVLPVFLPGHDKELSVKMLILKKIIELVIFIRMDITAYNGIFYIRTMAKYFLHILNKVFINNIKYF